MSTKGPNPYVTLSTWGTYNGGGNGMSHYLDSKFFGGNVGHAALEVVIPATEAGWELVRKYCITDGRDSIPCEKKIQKIAHADGKVEEQEVIAIYFSWWPGKGQDKYDLRKNLTHDTLKERAGVDFGEINPRFINTSNSPETGTIYGHLGKRTIHLGPKEILHGRNLTEDEKAIVEIHGQSFKKTKELESLLSLKHRLDSLNKVNENKFNIDMATCSSLDRYIPNWRENVKNPAMLTENERTDIDRKVTAKIEECKREETKFEASLLMAVNSLTKDRKEKISEEVNAIKALPKDQLEYLKINKDAAKQFSQAAWISYELEMLNEDLPKIDNYYHQLSELMNEPIETDKLKTHLQAIKGSPYFTSFFQNDTQAASLFNSLLSQSQIDSAQLEEFKDKFMQFILDNTREVHNRRERLEIQQKIEENSGFMQGNFEQYATEGLPPSHSVTLPVSGLSESEYNKPGLNIEKMLAKMREIASSGASFDLNDNNCSKITGSILAAGAEEEFKADLSQKALGGTFGTPQEVLNGAIYYQHTLIANRGKKPLLDKMANYNPLNAVAGIGGKIVKSLADPDRSTFFKISLGIVGIPILLLAGGVQLVKAITHPKKSYDNAIEFVKYAWANNSNLLKACSVPVAGFAGLIAGPALIQYGLEKEIMSPIKAFFASKKKPETQQSVPQSSIHIEDKYINIESQFPIDAIKEMEIQFNADESKIPVFTTDTQKRVNAYLNNLDTTQPEQAQLKEYYESLVKRIYERTNHLSKTQENEAPNYLANQNGNTEVKRKSVVSAFKSIKPSINLDPDDSKESTFTAKKPTGKI